MPIPRHLLCLLSIALLLPLTVAAQEEVGCPSIISTETPPYFSPALPGNGYAGKILQLLSEHAGFPVRLEFLPSKRFMRSRAPCIVGDPAMLQHEGRRAIFPLTIYRIAYFYYRPRHATLDINDRRQLAGLRMGVLRGTSSDTRAYTELGLKVEECNDNDTAIRMLQRGRLDFAIMVAGSGREAIHRLFPGKEGQFAEQLIPNSARPIALMIDLDASGGPARAARYRAALERTLGSPRYLALFIDYYGSSEPHILREFRRRLDNFLRFYADTWQF
jgi:polar amino acid transport system substrate-binding protein